MRKSKFTEEQIAFALRQAENGIKVEEVCRKLGVTEQTFYRWKQKYGGLGVSEQRACAVIEFPRATCRYVSTRRDDTLLRMRIREIARARVRYGYKRIHTLLRREGMIVNHKTVYRVYCEDGLNLRRKRPHRRIAAAHRSEQPVVTRIDECWSMDFVADALFNGQRFRSLTIVDNFSRESLAIPGTQGRGRRPCPRSSPCLRAVAETDQSRQWQRVHFKSTRQMGICEWCGIGFLPSWQAGR